jgi:ATP-binding cassette subfamily B protein
MPKPPMGKEMEKVKDFKGTFKKLINYIKNYKLSLIIVLLFAILSTVFFIVGPNILGDVTTEIFNGVIKKLNNTGEINFSYVNKTLTILVIIYVLSSICSFITHFIMNTISCKISYNLRKEISEKINKLPMKYFDKFTHGEILSRITNDVDTFSMNLSQVLSQFVSSFATIIGIIIMMIKINSNLTIVSLLILPISILSMGFIMSRSQKLFTRQQKNIGNINGVVEEIYGGHDVVSVFNAEEKAIAEFEKYNDLLYDSAWKSQFISTSMHPLTHFMGDISYVVISIYGGILTIQNKIQVGNILSFSQYVRNLNRSVSDLAQISALLQPTIASAERIFEFLDAEEEVKDTLKPVSINNINGEIEFKNVHFGYNDDKVIINDFNAKIKKGQKIAIVGPTGAGKTTIVKLLMRFYDINSGSICIDGHDIRDFNRSDLRSLFGMVLQDTWLFNGTIEENIKYGRLDATSENVKDACRAASVHHFIKTLPDTYNMVINEESDNISQGQKQLLTIARVILSDPKILILDEATSSVDTRTEILIQEAMDKLMEGRTSFIIAHRLSTIKNADLILVMKDGDIVETGTHKQLLKKGGFYETLYNSQFEETEE